MYYFAGTRLNFQPRDVLASNRNRSICLTDLLKYPARYFARNILRESRSVDFKDRHRRLFMENVTKIEMDLPQNLKIFLCVSERSPTLANLYLLRIFYSIPESSLDAFRAVPISHYILYFNVRVYFRVRAGCYLCVHASLAPVVARMKPAVNYFKNWIQHVSFFCEGKWNLFWEDGAI